MITKVFGMFLLTFQVVAKVVAMFQLQWSNDHNLRNITGSRMGLGGSKEIFREEGES